MNGIRYPVSRTLWTQGSEVLFLQTSAALLKQPPIVSAQGDSSYLRKWSLGGWGLSRELPLCGLPEPLKEDLPLPEDPLVWP